MNCIKCKENKPLENFYKDKQKKSGFKPRCKECEKLYIDRERRSEYEKKYWGERKERRADIVKRSTEKNSQKHKKKRKEYLKTDAGINTQRKSGQVTRCKKAGVYVEHVGPLSLYSAQGGICYLCDNKFTFKDMEIDHVIPVSKGGKHEPENVKMCCGTCNRRKGAKSLSEVIY